MIVAAAAYPVEAVQSWDALADKLSRWVSDADADLAVFPEYAGVEAALIGCRAPLTVAEETERSETSAQKYWRLIGLIAQRTRTTILAGSLPVRASQTRYVNRAALISPEGLIGFTDKRQLTPWERVETRLQPGLDLNVFALTALPRIATLICYDGEFPLQARAAREAGAQLLLMPSATESAAGATRVRLAARARAMENGMPVALAQTVGTCSVSAHVDVSTGRAGIYVPPDDGLPSNGILTETETDQPGWARATLPTVQPTEVDIAADWGKQHQTARPVDVTEDLP